MIFEQAEPSVIVVLNVIVILNAYIYYIHESKLVLGGESFWWPNDRKPFGKISKRLALVVFFCSDFYLRNWLKTRVFG